MEYFLSIIYIVIDTICIVFFFDAFANRRWNNLSFWVVAFAFILIFGCGLFFNQAFFDNDPIIKIIFVISTTFIMGVILYCRISILQILLLSVIEYLLNYALSFGIGMLFSSVYGINGNTFLSERIPFIIYSIFYYISDVFSVLLFRKLMLRRRPQQKILQLASPQMLLYFLFPCASFIMLIALLYLASGKSINEFFIFVCCVSIFVANIAIIFLLEQLELTIQNKAHLLSLSQQLQFQAKSMESARLLYESQQKKVHDFRSHINVLSRLSKEQNYTELQNYLALISSQQSDRLLLVNTCHPILNALFNTKASEAESYGIDICFNVNDLSKIPFDAVDMVVLLSNLIDNAIEACQKYQGERIIQITALSDKAFLFSIRNTTLPVKIFNNTIATTKSTPEMHGFGLSNIKYILDKYNGDYTMFYENGWFQFTGELPFTVL